VYAHSTVAITTIVHTLYCLRCLAPPTTTSAVDTLLHNRLVPSLLKSHTPVLTPGPICHSHCLICSSPFITTIASIRHPVPWSGTLCFYHLRSPSGPALSSHHFAPPSTTIYVSQHSTITRNLLLPPSRIT